MQKTTLTDIKNSFLSYLDDYLKYLQGVKNYSKLTIETYQRVIIEAIKVGEIYIEKDRTIFDIIKYRLTISNQNHKTINKKLSAIRSFTKYLENREMKIKLIGSDSIKSTQTLPKPIETKHIFESINLSNDIDKLIIVMLYGLGLRISELASIKLTDIKNNTIIVMGKGSKQRMIPMGDDIYKLIKLHIDKIEPKIYLFEKENKPLTKRQLQYKLEKIFKTLGLKVTPHQLRHSFATDLLNSGARINDIAELLGHSSLKATTIYTKLNTNTKLNQYNKAHPLNPKI